MADLERFLVEPTRSIQQVMEGIGEAFGIALVVDQGRHLIGTVTDGDIRRAILAGVDLGQPVEVLLRDRKPPARSRPVVALVGTSRARLLQMMGRTGVRHIPLLNKSGQVVDVALLDELVSNEELPLTAVVMAGGFGTRLRPLTDHVPKPMLPVDGKPLLEHIIEQLRLAGIRRVNITTHYKGEVIEEHFGDGSNYGVSIKYVDEKQPLGTAGALSLLGDSDGPMLVINGDILTRVDLRAMLDFHHQHEADMTVAVRQHEVHIPYGVVEADGVNIRGVVEKPVKRFLINAGIYLLAPTVYRLVPAGRRYDMTELIQDLISRGDRVICFPVPEYWLDIGHMADYARAQEDMERGAVQR